MYFNTCLFSLLTFVSFVSSFVIPAQRLSISLPSPREKIMERRSRFVMRQEPQPSSAAGPVPAILGALGLISTTSPTSSSPPSIATTTLSSNSPTPPSPTGPTLQPSQPPAATNGTPKYVIAHHMVGNTFPYTLSDWQEDIALAHAAGIDGFALNMGTDSWEPARVADA